MAYGGITCLFLSMTNSKHMLLHTPICIHSCLNHAGYYTLPWFVTRNRSRSTADPPPNPPPRGTIVVVKIMAMQTTWIGGKSVAKTTGKLIKGPRTSSGTPNHQLSKRKRKTKKRTAATRWSSLLALHFGTYQVAVDKSYVFTRFFESGNLKIFEEISWNSTGDFHCVFCWMKLMKPLRETFNSQASIMTA